MKRLLLLVASFALSGTPFTHAADADVAAPTAPATPTAPSSTLPSDQNYRRQPNYQVYFNDYLELKKGKPADLIFIGDSITEQWRWGIGWPVWKQHFEARALDFGLGSDRTQHTIWRLQNVNLSGFAPKVAVLLIGTNNTQDAPEDIAAGVKAVIDAIQVKFAGIRVIVLSILPNARAAEKMAAANKLIAPLADHQTVFYLDLAEKFTPDGTNWKGLGRDKLHLTVEGYEMWAAALEALLPTVLK